VSAPVFLAIVLAGGVGAVARFALDGAIRHRTTGDLPVGTIAINVVGSLVLGVVTGLTRYHGMSVDIGLVAGTGLCGGFTTFSAISFESVRLLQRREFRRSGVASVVTLGGSLGAAAVGLLLTLPH
jgi:fluoride exporter